MKSTPLVSVLMTAYNRERYIAQAIESVLVSTYKNWELIILDDGSQDKTVAIAETYQSKDNRVQVFRNKTNLGQFKNRNKIVDYANGKYIKYLDSDDLLYPFALEQLVYYMEQFPSAGYGLCTIDKDDDRMFPILLNPEEAYKRYFIEEDPIFHRAPLSSIIRTDLFKEVKGFPHEAVSGDLAMWCKLSLEQEVLLMQKGYVWYRVHENQEMQKTRDSILVEFEYLLVEEYFLNLESNPMNKKDKAIALKRNKIQQSKYIFWKFRQQGIIAALKLLKLKNKHFSLNNPS